MNREEASAYLIDRARTLDSALELLAQDDREFTVKAQGERLEEVKQARQGGIGLRVVKDGKTGYAYTEDLARKALDWALDEAVENAGLQQDTDGFIPSSQALGDHDTLGEGLSATVEEKLETALTYGRTLQADPRTRRAFLSVYAERELNRQVTSTEGASGRIRQGLALVGGGVVMGEGKILKQSFGTQWSPEFHALEPGRTAQLQLEQTGQLLNARRLATGRYTAYFESKAFRDLLAVFSWLWSGKSVMEGKSRLAGRIGESVASEVVNLIDDPEVAGGLLNQAFDVEGQPTRRTTLIERGVLKAFLHNTRTARALSQPPNGHAMRSYKGAVEVGPSNLYLAPGAGLKPDRGVVIREVMGVHAGANPISGDFSLQALGLWMEEGTPQYGVEDFVVSGNFLELLRGIRAVGNELKWDYLGFAVASPLVEVAGLSFAGA